MEKLLEKLDDAAKLVAPMLEEIEKLEIDFAVKNSLGVDKSLIQKSFPKEADQVSLISTLVTY